MNDDLESTDEESVIECLEDLFDQPSKEASEKLLRLAMQATDRFPWSAEIWFLCGIAMNRADRTAEEMQMCFERAIELDPGHGEAHEELGYVLDVYFDDFDRAAECFRRALSLGCGEESVYGLARVLAQSGQETEALHILDGTAQTTEIVELRNEILSGIYRR